MSSLAILSTDIHTSLIRACAEKRIIPFVGAGFSCNIAPEVAYRSFVNFLLQSITPAGLVFDPIPMCSAFQNDYPRINDFAIHKMGYSPGRSYYEIMGEGKKEFSRKVDTFLDNASLSKTPAHLDKEKWIQHLYLTRAFDTIFTTNWDRTIEYAASYSCKETCACKEKWTPRSCKALWLSKGRAVYLPPAVQNCDLTVVKYHGDIKDEQSMIAGEIDYYERMRSRDPMDYYLGQRLGDMGLMFLGYGFTDLNVRYALYQVNGVRRVFGTEAPSYLVMVDDLRDEVRGNFDDYMKCVWNVDVCWLIDWSGSDLSYCRPATIAGLKQECGMSPTPEQLSRIKDLEADQHTIVRNHVVSLVKDIFDARSGGVKQGA